MVCFRYIIVNTLHKGDNKDNIKIKLVGNTAKSAASKLIQRAEAFVTCHYPRISRSCIIIVNNICTVFGKTCNYKLTSVNNCGGKKAH